MLKTEYHANRDNLWQPPKLAVQTDCYVINGTKGVNIYMYLCIFNTTVMPTDCILSKNTLDNLDCYVANLNHVQNKILGYSYVNIYMHLCIFTATVITVYKEKTVV